VKDLVKDLVLYTSAEDVAGKAREHFPAHKRRTRAGVEDFVAGHPFVRNGVVSGYEIRDWNELLRP
jgi:hypothetical protein